MTTQALTQSTAIRQQLLLTAISNQKCQYPTLDYKSWRN